MNTQDTHSLLSLLTPLCPSVRLSIQQSFYVQNRFSELVPGAILLISDTVTIHGMKLFDFAFPVFTFAAWMGKPQSPLGGYECVHKSDSLRNCAEGRQSTWPVCETYCDLWPRGLDQDLFLLDSGPDLPSMSDNTKIMLC